MSKPKFTKGPWHVNCQEAISCDKHKGFFASVHRMYGDGRPEEVVIAEAKANASLIAQCPTMYQSLEDDMKSFRDTAEWLKKRLGNIAIVAAMFMRADEIEKLLKKARGEE